MCEISKMVVSASNNLLVVPGPESNRSLDWPTSSSTEHELRFSDGTHVPEPKMVTVIADVLEGICGSFRKHSGGI